MVVVAQLVEPRIVIPVVAGSNPVIHPTLYENFGAWRSLVAHLVWDQGVVGSNPTVPTNLSLSKMDLNINYPLKCGFFMPEI